MESEWCDGSETRAARDGRPHSLKVASHGDRLEKSIISYIIFMIGRTETPCIAMHRLVNGEGMANDIK